MTTFTKKFQTGTFGVKQFGDKARWTLTFQNGNTKYSYKLFNSVEDAKVAVTEHYIPLCQKRLDRGERVWTVYNVMSDKDGSVRPVFTNAEVNS